MTVPAPAGIPARAAGVLLHPTSLPGDGPNGVLGAEARGFVDWLAAAGFRVWQTLPLGPVGDTLSPYQVASAHAGSPLLIDLEPLVAAGLLGVDEVAGAGPARAALPARTWPRFAARATRAERAALAAYWEAERSWLLPYALFRVARRRYGDAGWWTWPAAIRDREPAALARLLGDERDAVRAVTWEQFLFDRQWSALRAYAAAAGVSLFGDVPIYVDLDSADAWWHREQFRLAPDGQPLAVAGVPPDYFSADGQLWGNPLYDWERMAADGYAWWRGRARREFRHFDFVRLDHFRGLAAYWEVPAGATTARGGCWREGPGGRLLDALRDELGCLPFVAEDLGTITADVRALRDAHGLPGMLILQFAFDGSPDNPYLPANHHEQAVVYTGTHDNDTLAGWYAGLDDATRARVRAATGAADGDALVALRDAAWRSPARLAMFPLQDLLGLDGSARMNRPGTVGGNWSWRFDRGALAATLAADCRQRAEESRRLAPEAPGIPRPLPLTA